jgi:hypothetical protein
MVSQKKDLHGKPSTHSSSPSQRNGALTVPPSKAVGRNSYQLGGCGCGEAEVTKGGIC